MYELNRVRLVGIGPRGARYDDVTLDLSDVGEPINGQRTLFDQVARRPSPFSLLMLENGGGKSVLLKLIFSVILPGRRRVLGGGGREVMENFVLAGDCGHVMLEWMHVQTGDRVVTGKVLEWRAKQRSDGTKLAEEWYSFRPGPSLEISTVPVTRDGRRMRLAGYHDELREADRLAPATQLTWVSDSQGDWTKHLRDVGIEPDLFDIQRSMNVDEGDAANIFKFTSAKEFVEWLLTTVGDPADAVSVAENFDSYATNVGDRDAMLLERDFAEGVTAGLEELGAAWDRLSAARASTRAADESLHTLARAVAARQQQETARAEILKSRRKTAENVLATREADRDRARDVANEVRRRTLELELQRANLLGKTIEGRIADARHELDAWRACEDVEQRDAAGQQAAVFAERITQAESTARPALQARDAAAARLVTKYEADIGAARQHAEGKDREAKGLKGHAEDLDRQRTEALENASTARAEASGLRYQVELIDQAIASAVADELLSRDDDIAIAADRAEAKVVEIEATIQNLDDRIDELTRESDGLAADLTAANEHVSQLVAAEVPFRTTLTNLSDTAADLAARETIHVALAMEAVDIDTLDHTADALLDQLADDITARGDRTAELRAALTEDQRVLTALGEGGLLPPRPECAAAVAALNHAGIAAHSGWRYLVDNVTPARRLALVTAHPELVDGVVLTDAAQLDAARDIVATARLLPDAAVVVGTGAGLLTAADLDTLARERVVVEPTPAMYDEDAAEERRIELRSFLDERQAELGGLDDALRATRDDWADLASWRRSCPAGRLAEIRANLADAERRTNDGRREAGRLNGELKSIDGETTSARLARREHEGAERAARKRSSRLRGLADSAVTRPSKLSKIKEQERIAEAEARRADELKTERGRTLANAESAVREADSARNLVDRLVSAIANVQSSTGTRAPEVPQESLPKLLAVYEATQKAYERVEVGADLRTEAEWLEKEAARLRAKVTRMNRDVVATAERLLATADGGDQSARSAAAARVTRLIDDLGNEATSNTQDVGRFKTELRNATPGDQRNVWIQLPPEWIPGDPEHGRRLHLEAEANHDSCQAAMNKATTELSGLVRDTTAAETDARNFREIMSPLEVVLDIKVEPGATPPFEGAVDQASREAEKRRKALTDARSAESAQNDAVTRENDELLRFVNEQRFERMPNKARRAILGLSRDALAHEATGWANALAQRLAALTMDLQSAEKHRRLIVDRLAALAKGSLKTLRTASQLSRLPVELGDWAGKDFLRIRFVEPDAALLMARIGELVDEAAAQFAARTQPARGAAPKRDGQALLLRAVDAAVPKGFTVEILKPDSVLRDERVPVAEMTRVFSGGQELTAAIILYCTLAALRANERGRMRVRHSGVLFLDNPIGKASASYLLDLQQGVAATLGVQLVYTTGLSDDRALAAFPLWVRMRNDADLRAGLKHIRIADVVRRALPEPYPDGADPATHEGTVTATRVFRRPPADADG